MATLWGRRAGTVGLGVLLVPLFVLRVAAGSQLQIYTPPSSQAPLGSGALLKCRFSIGEQIDLSSLRVQWHFSGRRILEYPPGQGAPQPGASISEQELRNGNASLSLARVTPFDQGPYKCIVGYGVEELQSETTLSVAAAPRISIPRRLARTDTESFFLCHVWGFYPRDVTITLLRDGRVLTHSTCSAPQRNPDGTFNLTLTYTFTPSASDSGSIFSCHVSHAALAQPLQEEFPLDVTESQLIVSVGPSPVRAVLGSDVLLPCSFAVGEPISLSKFYLAWARGGEKVAEYLREQPTQQPGVKLFPEELSRGNCSLGLRNVRVEDEDRYTSTLIYTPDRSEQHLELQVTAAPRLSIPRRSAGTDAATSFPCHVWGFYPGDVTVTWLRDGRVLTDASRSSPQRNPDGTFNLTLTYTFTPTASDSGSIFSCRVSHSALAQPLREEFPLDVTCESGLGGY
ncbi:natural cytotoxicity triggering receptor 3 ligand 1-like [Malaclemys terrapin pileata]|uniref:natural cytotoxicity triggering receptor 3 ligand 1-like n=1 Tax=Malaclemys terrapin pileata TaxID=2991368 RepID=UPI0023A84AA1|nr:natural cytotoxicity triggering receptor 3 ligand 1-like [Malaclemys terrapin pileata]